MQRFKGMLNNLEESKLEIVEYEDANNQSILHDIKELKNAFAGNSSREKPAQSKRNREQPQSSNVSFLFNSKVWNGDTWKEDNPSEFIKKFQNLKQNLKKDSNLQDDKMKKTFFNSENKKNQSQIASSNFSNSTMATTMIGPQPNFVPIPNHHPLNYYNYSFNYIPLGIPQCNQSGYAFSNQVKVNNYEGSLIPNCVNSINSQNFNPINHGNVKITNYNQNIYINNHYNKETKRENQTIPTNYNYLDDLSKQINIHNIIMGKDLRTTLMIRHVPNKYSLKNILEDINEEFKGTYDLFYLPVDFVNSCNLGYAFINFINSLYIIQFYENFRGKRWKRYKSDKICELVYGKIQGKNQLIKHFQRGTTMNIESVDKRPLILPTPKSFPIIQIPKKHFNEFISNYPKAKYAIDKESILIHSLYGI